MRRVVMMLVLAFCVVTAALAFGPAAPAPTVMTAVGAASVGLAYGPPIAGTGAATISAASAEAYTWSKGVGKVLVCNAPSSPATLYVRIGGSTASLSNWDVVLQAGDTFALTVQTGSVSIYADIEVDNTTEFSVKGCEG